jgi:hypothetical protein
VWGVGDVWAVGDVSGIGEISGVGDVWGADRRGCGKWSGAQSRSDRCGGEVPGGEVGIGAPGVVGQHGRRRACDPAT